MPLLAQWKKWTGLRASRGDREELSGGAEPVPRIAGPGNLQGVSPLHEEGTGRRRDPVETGGAGRPFSPLRQDHTRHRSCAKPPWRIASRGTPHARLAVGRSRSCLNVREGCRPTGAGKSTGASATGRDSWAPSSPSSSWPARWGARSASMTAARARSCVRPRGERARRRDGLAGPRRPPGQSGLKQALHGRGMDGLRQVSVEAGLPGMALVLGQPIAGQGDEVELLAVWRSPDTLGNLVSVDAGKTDVDEGHVGAKPQHQLDPRQAIGGLVNLVAVELEEHAKRLPRVGVVCDESDPPRRTRGRRL